MWLVFSAERRKSEGLERASRSSSVHYGKVSLEERFSQGRRADKHQVTRDPSASPTPAASAAFSCGTSLLCISTLLPEAGCSWEALFSGTAPHNLRQEPYCSGWISREPCFCTHSSADWQEPGKSRGPGTRAAELPAWPQCSATAPFPASPPWRTRTVLTTPGIHSCAHDNTGFLSPRPLFLTCPFSDHPFIFEALWRHGCFLNGKCSRTLPQAEEKESENQIFWFRQTAAGQRSQRDSRWR